MVRRYPYHIFLFYGNGREVEIKGKVEEEVKTGRDKIVEIMKRV